MSLRANRKSKAPWQLQPRGKPQSNPYAEQTKEPSGQFLSVPQTTQSKSRKTSRRLLIHASAMAQDQGFDPLKLPPLPQANGSYGGASLYRVATNNSDILTRTRNVARKEPSVVEIIRTEMRSADATALDDFYKSLTSQRAKVDKEVKAKINENQKNILELTLNLRATKQELLLLRVLTKELYGILEDFSEAAERRLQLEVAEPAHSDSTASLTVKRKRDRSLVVVLKKMWELELQLLYKHVDGAQKYVQALAGRHILAESGRFHEVNVGTWKPAEPVHLFVLNDAVLLAHRKKQQDGLAKRLQAVHFWPLKTVEMAQISRPDADGHFFGLRAANFSFVYKTDRLDHFLRIFNAYQKGKADLARAELEDARMQAQALQTQSQTRGSTTSVDGRGQLRDSLRLPRDSADMMLMDILARVHQRNRLHDFKNSGRTPVQLFAELKTNEDKLDEVDVHLARNEYMLAVGLITHIELKLAGLLDRVQELGKQTGAGDGQAAGEVGELRLLIDVVKLKITARKVKVQHGLKFDLEHRIAALLALQISEIIEFYSSLGQLEDGVQAVLGAYSAHLSTIVGRLISSAHGLTRVDIVNYLANLFIVYVLVVRRAVGVHRQCVEPLLRASSTDASGFVTWAIAEMQTLVDLVKLHASGSLLVEAGLAWTIIDQRYYDELVGVARTQLALLKAEGLNADYLFDFMFSATT